MNKLSAFLKKEPMLTVSLAVAIISLFITPPSKELLSSIDWHTLATLFMLLSVQGFVLSTTLDYFDEMGLSAFSSGINLILIVTLLVCNWLVNKVTGASLDKGIGG